MGNTIISLSIVLQNSRFETEEAFMNKILVLNGPNLDMLGVREPGIYGTETLKDIEEKVSTYGSSHGVDVTCFQSNSEGALIDTIHSARGEYDGIIYNPGAHTHYSYAIRDALAGIDMPCVEVHISDVDSREAFRAISVIAPICVAQVKGLGSQGYDVALDLLTLDLQEKLGEDYKDTATSGSVVVPLASASMVSGVLSDEEKAQFLAQAEALKALAEEKQRAAEQSQDDKMRSALNLTLPISTEAISTQLAAARRENDSVVSMPTSAAMGSNTALPLSVEEVLANIRHCAEEGQEEIEQTLRERTEGRISTRIGSVVAGTGASAVENSPASAEEGSTEEASAEKGSSASADAHEMQSLVPAVAPSNSLASSVRLGALRRLNEEQDRLAFLVRDTSNIAWLTAFDDVFDEENAHALLVTPQEALLHTDSRYYEALSMAASPIGMVHVDSSPVGHNVFVAQKMDEQEKPGRFKRSKGYTLGIEDSMALSDFRSLQRALEKNKASVSLDETSNVILRLRSVKDRTEIERMKLAQTITDAAFAYIVTYIRPGMTEKEVQIELEDFMLRHGAQGVAFPSIVACGANASRPHCVPGNTVLEAGQCVVLDFGARVFGYNSDMTRTVFLGKPDDTLLQAYRTIREANEAVERALQPGVTGKEMHELAEKILADNGFAGRMGHGLGHGVGIDIHELPVLSPRNPRPLQPGNVVTVEPGIYVEGSFGMRLEDFGVVTEKGYEVFTQSSHEPVVL